MSEVKNSDSSGVKGSSLVEGCAGVDEFHGSLSENVIDTAVAHRKNLVNAFGGSDDFSCADGGYKYMNAGTYNIHKFLNVIKGTGNIRLKKGFYSWKFGSCSTSVSSCR
uniref:Uncharacterized protein n=1 Tax=Megaselia scalaris TaxID=36166 RepID=T1H312_MEGSC